MTTELQPFGKNTYFSDMRLFTPKNIQFTDFYERGKFLLVWRLSIVFILVFFSLSLLYLGYNNEIFWYYVTVLAVSVITLTHLYYKQKHLFAFWVFTIFASCVVTLSLFSIIYTLHYADFLWMICIITFAFIGLGRKIGLIFLLYNSLLATIFIYFQLNNHLNQLMIHEHSQLAVVAIEVSFAFFVFGYLLHQYLIFQNYTHTELRKTNEALEKQNDENKFLLKEVHHRVKNNLQMIISLLKMQRDEFVGIDSKNAFNEAINRIMTISLVHERLYKDNLRKNYSLGDYLTELVDDIIQLSQNDGKRIDVSIKCDLKDIGVKSIIPFGLLINELLTNSHKHAFKTISEGKIHITVEASSTKKFKLIYTDSGKWNPNFQKGFGLELIELLTEQLEGIVHREDSTFSFELTIMDDERPHSFT